MKKLKFKTSKGEFVIIDSSVTDWVEFALTLPEEKKIKRLKLSEITEEQASEIVSSLVADEQGNKSYVYTLHSLLKSKGIHLFENPLQTAYQFDQSLYEYHQAEQKTFYKPYIFKI